MMTKDQLLCYAKSVGLDTKDYIYRKENNKYGIDGKDPIENPYFWIQLINLGRRPIEFLLDNLSYISNSILVALIQGADKQNVSDKEWKIFIHTIDTRYYDKYEKHYHFDDIMYTCIEAGNLDLLKLIVNYMEDNDIKPIHGSIGNINRGIGITEACKQGREDIVSYLVDHGADLSLDGEYSFMSALKYAQYNIAMLLVRKGVNPYVKRDIGFKLIQRNDKANVVSVGKNKEAYEHLCNIYLNRKKEDQ